MPLPEGEEIAEDIAEETAEVSSVVTEEMKVESDINEVSDTSIDVSAQLDASINTVNQESIAGIIEENPKLNETIQTDASSTVDNLTEKLEESGIIEEDIPAETGSRFSQTKALVRAGKVVIEKLKGLWERIKHYGGMAMKFSEFYIMIDMIVRKISEIISAIKDATKNPPWKGSITEEQKKQLALLQDAVDTMKPLFEGLEEAIKPLEENIMSYGTIMVKLGGKEEEVQVLDVVAHIIEDSELQMKQASDTMKDGIDGLTVLSLTQISNNVFSVFANTQALVDLRDNKNNLVKNDQLKMYKFPPEEVEKTTNKVLSGDFPQWKEKVNSQGYSLAVMGAGISTGAFVKSQVIMKVNAYMRREVYPVIKEAAKTAGIKAAKEYVKKHKAKIIAEALIPGVGIEMAKQLGEKIKNEAIEKAKKAAKDAGQRKAIVLQRSMETKIKPIVDDVMKANKDQMMIIAKYAAQQMMDIVVPPEERSGERAKVALPAGVTHADIGLARK